MSEDIIQYKVSLKKPQRRSVIWAGPQHQTGYLEVPESAEDKTRREAIENRIRNTFNIEPKWVSRTYSYLVEITAAQAEEVRSWGLVRKVEVV